MVKLVAKAQVPEKVAASTSDPVQRVGINLNPVISPGGLAMVGRDDSVLHTYRGISQHSISFL